MDVTGSRPPVGGVPSDVALELAELQIVPGETARFPFTVYTEREAPTINDFDVVSDNPNFNPAWSHVGEHGFPTW
jgi:hypothetical protein